MPGLGNSKPCLHAWRRLYRFVTGANTPEDDVEGPAGTSTFETTGAEPGSAVGDAIVSRGADGSNEKEDEAEKVEVVGWLMTRTTREKGELFVAV